MPCATASARSARTSSCRSARAICGCAPTTPSGSSSWRGAGSVATTRRGAGSRARCGRRWRSRGAAATRWPRSEVRDEVRNLPEIRAALDRMWPLLTPAQLLHDLFGSTGLLRLAADGILEDFEFKALHRPRSESVDDVRWTGADVALLDDAREVLGPQPTQSRQAQRRRRDPHLRPHRDRRGARPHADAAQDGDSPLAQRVDDRRRRHRPGHRCAGARRLGGSARPPARAASRAG